MQIVQKNNQAEICKTKEKRAGYVGKDSMALLPMVINQGQHDSKSRGSEATRKYIGKGFAYLDNHCQ